MNVSASSSFGELLRHYRIAAGLTQEMLAERARISARAVSDLECGRRRRPRSETIELLAAALCLSPDECARLGAVVQRARREPIAATERTGSAASATETRETSSSPHNLPAPLTSFVGREQEIADVIRLLKTTRLLTLMGIGGVGKTRLALQVGSEILADYPDGVWLVDLAPLSDPALVLPRITGVLGIGERPDQPLETVLISALRARRTLLVLDNCEHLVETCAQLSELLLANCPRLQMLATSRTVLGISGEVRYHLPPLPVPFERDGTSAPNPLGYAAVELFADRARAIQPDFALTPQNGPAIVRICAGLDGIPLAIELAASRVAVLTVEQITARLDQRFRLLSGGNRTALRRQQTLQATIDWSYDLLSPPERVLLRRLAVFVRDFPLEAAEFVGVGEGIEADEILDVLARLVANSLVLADDHGGGRRYRFLETIRQYAMEKLVDAGEVGVVRARHRDYYLALAERARIELEGPAQGTWLDQLEQEHDNLRAALDWCQTDPQGAELQLRLAGALGRFWSHHRDLQEGHSRLKAALARPAPASSQARALALNWAGNIELLVHNAEEGKVLLEEGVSLARAAGDLRLLSQTIRHLSLTLIHLGEAVQARALLEEGLAISQRCGSQREIAYQLYALASALDAEGPTDRGEQLFEESLAVARESGDALPQMHALGTLGIRAAARGDYPRGRAFLAEALAIAFRLRFTMYAQLSNVYLGNMARLDGDLSEARRCCRELLKAAQAGPENARNLGTAGLLLAGSIAVAADQECEAAQLFGAAGSADGTWHGVPGIDFSPWIRLRYAEDLATARSRLGEAAFAQAWAEGQAMTLEEAVAYALESSS